MSYNIKDFWLRFDGESGSITLQGAELDQDDLEVVEVLSIKRNQMLLEYWNVQAWQSFYSLMNAFYRANIDAGVSQPTTQELLGYLLALW